MSFIESKTTLLKSDHFVDVPLLHPVWRDKGLSAFLIRQQNEGTLFCWFHYTVPKQNRRGAEYLPRAC